MRRGQALLVVLLVLGVALTVGLSIVSRSITEVSTSTTQEESGKALSAAEAGVEKALGQISSGDTVSTSGNVTGATYTLQKSDLGGSTSYVYPEKLVAGDVATIKLPSSLNTLRVCWGDNSLVGNNRPAIELTVYYGGANVSVYRQAYDPGGRGGFTAAAVDNQCPLGTYYGFLANLSGLGNTLISARLRLFYNGSVTQPVGVVASANLPFQGSTLTSSGMSGQTTQKVQVNEVNPDVPPIFDVALFSGGSLSQ